MILRNCFDKQTLLKIIRKIHRIYLFTLLHISRFVFVTYKYYSCRQTVKTFVIERFYILLQKRDSKKADHIHMSYAYFGLVPMLREVKSQYQHYYTC